MKDGFDSISACRHGMTKLLACQQAIHTKGQVPSIICYTDDQMTDLKHYLHKADNPIVGVDRTFNLGSFFVTSLVYKKPQVICFYRSRYSPKLLTFKKKNYVCVAI
jgi:hypothetical protein